MKRSRARAVRRRKRVTPRRVGGGSTARRRRRFKAARKRSPPGIVSKAANAFRGLRLALPGIGALQRSGLNAEGAKGALFRYTGFSWNNMALNEAAAKKAAVFWGTNIGVATLESKLGMYRMAARKKILAILGAFLPELSAIGPLAKGDTTGAMTTYGQTSIGYSPPNHLTWLETPWLRDQFFGILGARVGLTLASKFIGPRINKFLPKGINL